MIGQTLSHYRIEEMLGAGGMGVVYRARDLRLKRDVALKVLPNTAKLDEQARKRFLTEAVAISRLNHPNIDAIYDFDSQDGVDFLVMEYVSGASLAEKLRSGPIAEPEAVALAVQVAEALEAAHEKGVIHRDLKPGNIMVTPRGQVKVLDFGLAKLLYASDETVTAESVTQTRSLEGTLPYMAPEQVQGADADPRLDLYSLGVVLYQMTTGRLPYEQKVAVALIHEIVNASPRRPHELMPGLSLRVEKIILRCLEKDPAQRYPSARELLRDLRGPTVAIAEAVGASALLRRVRWAAPMAVVLVAIGVVLVGLGPGGWGGRLFPGLGGSRIDALAVLPLLNLSGDPGQEYFADGMTEEIITNLNAIRSLKVISRTSAMRYKGTTKLLPQIARELGVRGIVEGSVLRAGERVRINVRLTDAARERTIWTDRYERPLTDVLALQRDVAVDIAQQIRIKITPQESARLAGRRAVDPEAYELYLKGRFHWAKLSPEGIRRGLEFYGRAIASDSSYAPAYAGLADAYVVMATLFNVPPDIAWPKAKAYARKALELDDSNAEAHASMGSALMFADWDWAGAELHLRRAIELNPGYPTGLEAHGLLLVALGRFDEAVSETQKARELDPLSLLAYEVGTVVLYYAGRCDEAAARAREALEIDSNFKPAQGLLARCYQRQGRYQEVVDNMWEAGPDWTRSEPFQRALRASFRRGGALGYHRTQLDSTLSHLGSGASSTWIAHLYAEVGERDSAFAWLGRAVEWREPNRVFLKVDPTFDVLRQDPRYDEILRRIGFPAGS